MAMSFYFLIPTLPVYFEQILGAEKTDIGIVLSMFAVAALIIRPFTGWAVDRWGRRWIYLVSLLALSLMFPLYGFVYTLGLMAAFRFLHGLAWGITSTSGATIVVDILPPHRRGEGIGLFGLSMTLGMALGPYAGMMVIQFFSYETLFVSGGALSLCGLLMASFVRVPEIKQNASDKSFFGGLVESKALPASLNVLLLIFAYGGLLSFVSLYGKEIGVENPGVFFILFAAGLGVSRILSGKIFDLRGPLAITITGISMLLAGLPLLAMVKNFAGYCAAAVILGGGYGIVISTFQAMVNNLVQPENRGAANSTLFTAFDLGIGGGMIITGLLSQTVSISGSFLLSSVLIAAGLVVFIFFVNPHYNRYKTVPDTAQLSQPEKHRLPAGQH